MKKVIRDGLVAVLCTTGYGAGWSTWNVEYPEILFDPVVVDALEMDLELSEIEGYLEGIYPNGQFEGYRTLGIKWVKQGTEINISEYDGLECVATKNSKTWHTV